MAEFGANYPCFKREDADTGVVLGKLVSANLTVNLASGEIYADDSLAEQLSEFSSGTIAMETDDLTDANAAEIYGCKVSDGLVTYNTGDTAPRGHLGYYKVLMRNGKKYYKAYFYPRVRASLGNDNAQTKGSSITFQTSSTTFTVFADDVGDWRQTETFDSAAAAKAWVDNKCSISTYYSVDVSVQGASTGEGVSPLGINYVASGENFELTITGYSGIVAAYDNGNDISSTITSGSGKYTISSIAEDHTIAIIF